MSTTGLSWTVYTWRGSCQWRSEKWVEQPMHWQVIHAKPKGNRNLSVTLIEVPMSDAILPHSPGKREDLHKPVGLWPCHNQGGNQYWMLSKQGEIRQVCITLIGWRSRAYPYNQAGRGMLGLCWNWRDSLPLPRKQGQSVLAVQVIKEITWKF